MTSAWRGQWLRCLLATALLAVEVQGSMSNLQYVNPFIGTDNGGHVFAGATVPFGMAKAVADTSGSENLAGFATDGSNITGFSHMHDDGTGGSPSLGNFPIFAHASCPGDDFKKCAYIKAQRATARVNDSARAHPGYFSIELASGIRTEMTVSNHTALYRFTFPDSQPGGEPLSPLFLSDLNDIGGTRSWATVKVDAENGRMTGMGSFRPSFGTGIFNLYFCADFKGAVVRDSGTWTDSGAVRFPKALNSVVVPDAGAWVRFQTPASNNEMLVRVGVSFQDANRACHHAEREIPTFDFAETRAAAVQAWSDKLDVIQVISTGMDSKLLELFWSSLYRNFISPQDYTGENYRWNSTEPYYDSYYCIWDSFRSIHPLITLLDPLSQSRMVRSLIDIYQHEGWLPDCRMSLCKGYTQGGSNADVVLVDSYLKGIQANWSIGYKAILKDAEAQPLDWAVEGRGSLYSWAKVGYVPKDDPYTAGSGLRTRSISRTVEYAYDDFCIATMAKSIGDSANYTKYIQQSENWRHLYNDKTTSNVSGKITNFKGFLQPKYYNGTFAYQDPTLCSPLNQPDGCYLSYSGHETYEGSCWLYSFFVPGDMASLIKRMGGDAQFTRRLNFLHNSGLVYIGDEQSFLTVFLYHYAGRPGLSARRAHDYVPSQFNTTNSGIPGNDDSGAMGSFVVFMMMGLFPNAGQNVYLITPPFFESVSITNKQTGKTATIRNINFDPSYRSIYIQSAKLNGQAYTKNWLDHRFFLEGGTLELTLGAKESAWGTNAADRPPSLSTTGIHL